MAASGTAQPRSEGQNSRRIGLQTLWSKREKLLFLMMRYLGPCGGKMKEEAVREGVITEADTCREFVTPRYSLVTEVQA